jgi:hypothetical protein
MSEKRQPVFTVVAEKFGKKIRLECFTWRDWKTNLRGDYRGRVGYRLRKNGKWLDTIERPQPWTTTEIFDELRKWTNQ